MVFHPLLALPGAIAPGRATGPAKLPGGCGGLAYHPAGQAGGARSRNPSSISTRSCLRARVEPHRCQAKPQADASEAPPADRLYLQAGAFEDPSEADNVKAQLALMGIEASVQRVQLSGRGNCSQGSCRTLFVAVRTRAHAWRNGLRRNRNEHRSAVGQTLRPVDPQAGQPAWRLNVLTESMTGFRSPRGTWCARPRSHAIAEPFRCSVKQE